MLLLLLVLEGVLIRASSGPLTGLDMDMREWGWAEECEIPELFVSRGELRRPEDSEPDGEGGIGSSELKDWP